MRTPTFPASFITRAICASWSAAGPTICGCSADQRALFEAVAKEAPGFAFVVRSMQIDFRKPARMDDVLEIMTVPLEVKGASIVLYQRVNRAEELLVEATVQVAFVSGGRARPIPKALRTAMKAGQASAGGD
jgi:acyl-CoA thioester hydrolase